jgi:Zn finger protein HypA/HybF involved in hydrogenase expression
MNSPSMPHPYRWYAGLIGPDDQAYRLTETGRPGIQCLLCGLTSYHPAHIANLYCPYCSVHHFHLHAFRNAIGDEVSSLFPINLNKGCPDCGGNEFRVGPRGGMNRNVECIACESRFNMVWGLGVAHRITHDGEPYYDPTRIP